MNTHCAGQIPSRTSSTSGLLRNTSRPFVAICVAILMTGSSLCSGADLQLPELWKVDLASLLESSATVADLDGDGHPEVLIAGREELFARSGKGKALWSWKTKGRFMTYPTVLERPGKPSLVYVADTAGALTCLDGKGAEVWHAALKGPSSWSAAVVCEMGGGAAVIQTDETGCVWAFAADTGKVLWQSRVKGIPVSPAVGDLDGDGKPEVVVATGEGMVFAFKEDGKALWELNIGGSSASWSTAAPVIFAGSDGKGRVGAASSTGQFYCIDSAGAVLWKRPTRGAVASTISVGDLDLDGRADICLVTQIGVIHRFDETGRVLWEIDMQGRSLAPGAMIDLDGDGKLEYVLCTQDGFLQVLNNQGEYLHRYHFKNRTINVTPAFGDLDQESPGLEMVVTGGELGFGFCLGTPAPTNATAHWRSYRGDAHNSGSWFGLRQAASAPMLPMNLEAERILAGEEIRFVIRHPGGGGRLVTATAGCVAPGGGRQVATATVSGGGELGLPLSVLAAGDYRFEWSLSDADGGLIAKGSRTVFLQPFMNERALASRAQELLRSAIVAAESKLPLAASGLRRELLCVETESNQLRPQQDAVSGGDPGAAQEVLSRSAGLVARSRRAVALAELIQHAVAAGAGSLVAFEGTTWENRKVDEQLPPGPITPLRVTRTAVAGEHEPVSVNLFNVADHELLVRVVVDALTNGVVATPHRSVAVPSSQGDNSWDALPELDETGTISIPPFTSRELWLDLNLRDVKPGEHRVGVRLQSINGAGVLDGPKHPHTVPPPETTIEILLKVPSFAMVPDGEFRLCTWAAPEEAVIPDLLAHGNNVFPTVLPVVKYDGHGGGLLGSDYSKLDPVLGRLRGKDVVLLLQGFPALRGDVGASSYVGDLKRYLAELVTHMAGAGFDTNHFALYPYDEPGGAGWAAVNQVVAFGKQVRAVNPSVMVYMDGGGELPMFEAMATCIDIWTPSIYMLAEKTPLMDLVRRTGKMLWSYNCSYSFSRPVGPNLKNMNMIIDYRAAALVALRHGATGIGFWCYNIGGDPWGRMDLEYQLVYPGRSRPVPSRRWEAVREGIEDYRIIAALRKRMNADGAEKLGDGPRAQIRHLLEVSLPGMIDTSLEEMARGAGRSVLDSSANDRTIAAFRAEMMRCVEAVAPIPGR